MATIQINGNSYSGNNVVVNNNRVIIDGIDVTPDSKQVNISVTGNIDNLQVDSCYNANINGHVNNAKTISGDLEIHGNVSGSVSSTSGDVLINGSVGGNVSTVSGDIKRG